MSLPLRPREEFPQHTLQVDPSGEQFVTYTTLTSGETIAKIAKIFGMNAKQLVDAN